MAHIGYPTGPQTYHPQRDLIDYLHKKRTQVKEKHVLQCKTALLGVSLPYTYQMSFLPQPDDEEHTSAASTLTELIRDWANHKRERVMQVTEVSVVAGYMTKNVTGYASESCTEPVLVHRLDGIDFPLFAIGTADSQSAAMAQAVAIAADCCLNMERLIPGLGAEVEVTLCSSVSCISCHHATLVPSPSADHCSSLCLMMRGRSPAGCMVL